MNSKTHQLSWSRTSYNLILSLVIVIFMLGCSSTQKKSQQSNGPTIHINSNMMKENSEDFTFWLSFALGKSSCREDYPADSFGEFSCAFKLASAIGASIDEQPNKKMSEFQVAINSILEAGFINEYMFHSYRKSHWFAEPHLNTEQFNKWMNENLPNHIPSSDSAVSVEAKVKKIDQSKVEEVNLNNNFKTSVGNLLYQGQYRYEKPSLGLSLRYQIVGREDGWIDFYIYPNLISPENLLKRNSLIDEATSAKIGIMYHAQKENIEDMEVLEETSNEDISFLKGQYELIKQSKTYISELYLAGNDKYFLKARGSYLKGAINYTDQDIKVIFDSILANAY